MKRMLASTLVWLVSGLVLLSGCVPPTPQAGGPAPVGPAPAATSASESTRPAQTTSPASALATVPPEAAIATVVSSPRLVFEAAALAQPAPVGNGLFRVGTIEVSGPGLPGQTLDVVMDQPNSEWAQMPLRTDDLNFDDQPDLIVTQPVGARWGRLHAWLYDAGTQRFITNTLTTEVAQLRAGDFRVDVATKTLQITNTLGMTPFAAAYSTVDGYLMPVLPAPGPADAGACPAKAPGMLLLREELHDYCLLYPEGFEAQLPTEDEVLIGEPGSMGHGPMAFIRVDVLGEKTVEQIADELLAPFAQLTPEPGRTDVGFIIHRSSSTLDGEPAVILEGVPGQDMRRMVLVGHRGHLYELTFVPASRNDEAYTVMEALFAAITRSWRFLEPGTEQPAATAAPANP